MAFNAQNATKTILGVIVGILVAAVLIASLLPVAVNFIMDTDTSSWGTAESTLFDLFPLIFVLVPFLGVIAWVYKVM